MTVTKPTGKRRGRPPKSDKAPGPNVAAAAAKLTDPDGEGAAPLTNAERQRRHREGKKAKAEAPAVSLVVDDGDIAAAGELGAVVWDIIGPFARLRPLDDSQKLRLGGALAPLVKKYLPLLADWQYEAAALFCVLALARETHIPKDVPPASGEEGEANGLEANPHLGN